MTEAKHLCHKSLVTVRPSTYSPSNLFLPSAMNAVPPSVHFIRDFSLCGIISVGLRHGEHHAAVRMYLIGLRKLLCQISLYAAVLAVFQNSSCRVFVGDKRINHVCSQCSGDRFRLVFSAGNGNGFLCVPDVIHGGT